MTVIGYVYQLNIQRHSWENNSLEDDLIWGRLLASVSYQPEKENVFKIKIDLCMGSKANQIKYLLCKNT